MTDAEKTKAEAPKRRFVVQISGILALIVMAVSTPMYIDEGAGAGEIFDGIIRGVGTGSMVLVVGWVAEYFVGRNTEKTET